MKDTIASISTALGIGAISIIRVSGNESINIVNKITKFKKLLNCDSHTIVYDFIVDNEDIIDEVLISIMKAPKTFTVEDIVEINCHGGIATTNKILELLLETGCRLAEPGEFTKRAFLNGRIDLIEAEGVMDLINSTTDMSRKAAVNQISGKTSGLIKELRQKIIEILASIEVNIDYPEYDDIEQISQNKLLLEIKEIESQINILIKRSENERIIKEGIKIALIGKPNVGKSSLLNRLLEKEKAIVTDIAGTTRDIVEDYINLDGVLLKIIDTAGIRNTSDLVEKLGVEKSKQVIDEVDLVLCLINNGETLAQEDLDIIDSIKNKNHLIVVNKSDLERKINLKNIESDNFVFISTITNEGIEPLKKRIKQLFNLEQLESKDLNYLLNARAISFLKKCLPIIKDIEKALDENLPIDMIEIDIKNIWEILGLIIGESYEDELIEQLFSQFCLGK